jgi:hypothetical protein
VFFLLFFYKKTPKKTIKKHQLFPVFLGGFLLVFYWFFIGFLGVFLLVFYKKPPKKPIKKHLKNHLKKQ